LRDKLRLVLVSPRCCTFFVAAALGSLLLACGRKTPAPRGRSVPVCATQDCVVGSTSSSVAPLPDASSHEPSGGGDAAPDAAPAPPLQLRALAGDGTAGVFWIPAKGDFPFEDLLLQRDGQYVTHLHDRPGAFGTWHMDGDTLTLDGWMGDGQYVLRGVHVDAHELRGLEGSTTIVLHRMR
jgi:hypothetical protein